MKIEIESQDFEKTAHRDSAASARLTRFFGVSTKVFEVSTKVFEGLRKSGSLRAAVGAVIITGPCEFNGLTVDVPDAFVATVQAANDSSREETSAQ